MHGHVLCEPAPLQSHLISSHLGHSTVKGISLTMRVQPAPHAILRSCCLWVSVPSRMAAGTDRGPKPCYIYLLGADWPLLVGCWLVSLLPQGVCAALFTKLATIAKP